MGRGTYESYEGVPPGLSCLSPRSGLCSLGGCPPSLTFHPLPQLQSAGASAPLGALQVCWEPQAAPRRCQAGLQAQPHCGLGEPLPWVGCPWHPLSRAPSLAAPLTLFPVPLSWPNTGCSTDGFSCPNWENQVRDMVSARGEEAWMFFLSLGPRADQAAAFPPPAWSLTAPTDMGSGHPSPDPVPPGELIGKAAWKAQPGGGGEGT